MKTTAHAGDPARIRIVASSTVLATGLATPLALAGPGDLDPSFGKVGRVVGLPDVTGPAWSLDARDGDVLIGGIDQFCDYYFCDVEDGFVFRLGDDGGLDEAFAAARLADTNVRDVAVLPDGRAVAVATRLNYDPDAMIVFRLRTDGTLDTSFGVDGIAQIPAPAGVSAQGTSLLLEPDGRITVAGRQGDKLILARLLPNGALDTSFGTGGSFVWDVVIPAQPVPKFVRVGGGYRVLVHAFVGAPGSADYDCRVLALTENGTLDSGYGSGGLSGVVIPEANGSRNCVGIGAQGDGRVVVAGTRRLDRAVFAARLLSTGAVDPLFPTDAATASLSDVTALAVGSDDSIALAGQDKSGLPGALVVRLQADGMLDLFFGRNGSATVALESQQPSWAFVSDLQVLQDGAIVMSGVSGEYYYSDMPFVARLLGNASGGGPGVADIPVIHFEASETAGAVDVSVRRIGGRTGPITVGYETVPVTASAGGDFGSVTGQLTWADGDDADKVITVPIFRDTGPAERPELFDVRLVEPGGGAGIATSKARVTIQGDSYPAGTFTLGFVSQVSERDSRVDVFVNREDYGGGAVEVELAISGTAANGQDYRLLAQTYRFSWADGDRSSKMLTIPLINDRRKEGEETITLALSGATGGALIAEPASATVTIVDDDASSGGGGGHAGGLFALLSALAGLLRLRRRAVTRRQNQPDTNRRKTFASNW